MIAEFSLWAVLIGAVYILKLYFDKKSEHSVDSLKHTLFEIVAKNKNALDKEGYESGCRSVATMAISKVVEVIDSLHRRDKEKYSQELIEKLNEFMNNYIGEEDCDCEVSNGQVYAQSVVSDVIAYLKR